MFLHGHGFWTSLENVVVGPFIAIISFVCSIGNVPLAAALWKGGISFGGVVAFIFADLITFPLLLIYRRYYGTRLMLRMLATFWAVMSAAGLITEGLFRVTGLVPDGQAGPDLPPHFQWNYTTYLNIVFLALFGVLYWAYRNRQRLGGGEGEAMDPGRGPDPGRTGIPPSGSALALLRSGRPRLRAHQQRRRSMRGATRGRQRARSQRSRARLSRVDGRADLSGSG